MSMAVMPKLASFRPLPGILVFNAVKVWVLFPSPSGD